jgi:hypothetical protein
MDFEDLEPRHKIKKLLSRDDVSAADPKGYVVVPQAKIMRVETAIMAKEAHLEAMNSLFETPGQ